MEPDPDVGETETTAGIESIACVTTKFKPAAVKVALRVATVVFAPAVKVKVVVPIPLAGLTVNQLPVDDAVHVHPPPVNRLAVMDPPAAGRLDALGVSEIPHPPAVWVTVYEDPAIVIVPDRAEEPGFAATVNVTKSSPVALAPEFTVIQLAVETAVTAQL